MISIIIPTFQEEKYLSHLLDDIEAQSVEHEIIVVDACSTDRTRSIAKKRARVFTTKERNASIQRNCGAKYARYAWLLFVDADMRLPEDALQRCLHRDAVAVFPHITLKQPSLSYRFFVEPSYWLHRLFPGFFARGGCMLIRKAAFDSVGGFNTRMSVAEDRDLGQRLRGQGMIKVVGTRVFESDRRFKKLGYVRVLAQWWLNGFWGILFGKSFYSVWYPIR